MSERLKALQHFRDLVVSEAKANLRKLKKDSSGKLSNSIKGDVKEMPNSIGVYFEMEPYGNFQDKGVSGVKQKFDTPYSYKSKMPPPNKLDKWIVRKGIAPRSKGKFKGRSVSSVGFKKSIQFLIARSIFYNGIKPSLFFTKPFEAAYKTLPDELIDKYGLDAEQLVNEILDQNLKNIK
jgi:hypothetical protein